MTDNEIDLIYRVSRHPLWVWVPGMLGVEVTSETVFTSGLNYERYGGEGDFSKFSPSIYDSFTVYLIWEGIKNFNVDGYSLVRSYESNVYKAGFKKGDSKSILLYSSASEGILAIRMWIWFASKHIRG